MNFHFFIKLPCVNVRLAILFPLKFSLGNHTINELSLQNIIVLEDSPYSMVLVIFESSNILKLLAVVNSLFAIQLSINNFSLIIRPIRFA